MMQDSVECAGPQKHNGEYPGSFQCGKSTVATLLTAIHEWFRQLEGREVWFVF